ncbi:MAG: chromosome segregation protein SMC, partial [Candidatus Marsarchaeota archaeon]|nr:chromosome segregation protein SMC [Candidatus Marsarchaeota archaeon]
SGGGTDRMNDEIKREIKQGFHGRAYELCTYEDKYSNAIIAAAGSRFNYFVVESISVATSAIKLIRDKKLGRASFIPMADIYGKKPAVQEGVTQIMDLVKFDKKYEKVFSFVFANTYLVNTIADGKKHGLGNLRYVTMEGDILEPSGVVSGGFSRQVAYPGKLRLELEKVAGQKQELLKEIAMVEAELESEKKAVGSLEVDLAGSEIEIKRMNSSISYSSGELLTIKSEIDAKSKSVKGTEREIDAYASKCSNLAKEISAIKEKQALSYKAMSTALHAGKSSKASKEEIETAKKQRAELESLKMQYASISKENDMLDLRIAAIKDEMRKASDTINKLNAAVKEKEAHIAKGMSSKAELEEMIRSHDKGSESIYNELLKLEKSLSEMGFQKGRLTGESDKLAKELSEAETRKAQAQTRLNDIKAELSGRIEVEEAKGSINELESRLAVLKNDLEKMGVVNLKAPEMYEIKSKDLEGAIEKLDTLESEKTSILGMIKEIESKKLDVFMDTFKAVERNMQKLYNYTYDDEVVMSLDNPKDPFNSGLSISVRKKDKGGRIKSVDELSGGQKSFILIVMLFAIQMRNRMSFYIFDEIDSALDKENSKKLSKLIKEISSNSQFIVVSHNDTLISAADTAIGFSMQNDESKAVGIQLVGVGN